MKDYLSKLSSREISIVTLAAMVLLGMLVHALIIEPYIEKKIELDEAIEQGRIDLNWMQSAVYKLPQGGVSTSSKEFEGSLANLINKLVKSQNLDGFLTQMTPVSDNEIRVRYKSINFNRLLNFIAQVNRQGLKVKDLRINASDKAAYVDCSLILEKNA